MKKYTVLFCGLAVALSSSTPILADDIFNFSFTGNNSVSGLPGTPFSGSGAFDANLLSPGLYQIVAVTGTTDGQTIANILAPGGFGNNDNLLSFPAGASSPSLDNAGVSYLLDNNVNVNLFFGVPGQYQQSLFGFPGQLVSEAQASPIGITPAATLSAVPEPASLALLGTGLLGVVGAVRRRLSSR